MGASSVFLMFGHIQGSLEGLPPGSRPQFGKVSPEQARSQLSTTPAMKAPRILAPGCEFRTLPLIFPGSSFLHGSVWDRMYSHKFRERGSEAGFGLIPCNPDPTLLTSDVLGRWKSKFRECVHDVFLLARNKSSAQLICLFITHFEAVGTLQTSFPSSP